MPSCVEISGGYVVASAESFPDCSQFALVEPSHLERLTYFADLAIALDPADTFLWEVMGASLLVFITAFGFRVLARQLFNR